MEGELKKIKKIYGEDFAKLCRRLFPTILEEEGKLLKILLENFAPTRSLYDTIMEHEQVRRFKAFIFNKAGIVRGETKHVDETPEELMAKVGYKLIKCETEEDIQAFKKYYDPGEELCTFGDKDRIKECHIFFAVREDADSLKREDFKSPKRQDAYGTSVISIQFDKRDGDVSIKNRYNHSVDNPDSTFSNDLDSIVPDLEDSFATHYGIEAKQTYQNLDNMWFPGYIRAKDGKRYKYNYENRLDNLFICENNIVIKDGKVIQYDKSRYELVDHFLIDKSTKTITNLFPIDDSFMDEFVDVDKIEVENTGDGTRKIIVTKKDETYFVITVDKSNSIVGYENNFQTHVSDNFLAQNKKLKHLQMDNVETIGRNFLYNNEGLEKISLPKVREISSAFLHNNVRLSELYMPEVVEIGNYFMQSNENLLELSLPQLEYIGAEGLYWNIQINSVYLPELKRVPDDFLTNNKKLKSLSLPKVTEIGDNFLRENEVLEELYLPEVVEIGTTCFGKNQELETLYLPKVEYVGSNFFYKNEKLQRINLPRLESAGSQLLAGCKSVKSLVIPEIHVAGSGVLKNLKEAEFVDMPALYGMTETVRQIIKNQSTLGE